MAVPGLDRGISPAVHELSALERRQRPRCPSSSAGAWRPSAANRIAEIVNNRRRISADTALRLSLFFGNSPEFWTNLQAGHDLKTARRQLPPEEAERIRRQRAA